jgi:pyruvate kinase
MCITTAVLLDTKGPEIRTGFFANDASKISLVKGDTIILTAADYSYKGDATKMAVSYPQLADSVVPGQEILVADGSLVLTVLTTDPSRKEVSCRIENNATIGERYVRGSALDIHQLMLLVHNYSCTHFHSLQ